MTAEDFLNPVVRDLPPSGIRKFFDLVANTKGVISLGVGEPDFVTPWFIREACLRALEQGYTMYSSNWGLPELRQEIASYLERRFGVTYDPVEEILVTVGASQAIDLSLRAVLRPGDEVLIPEPNYVSYKPCTLLAGGTPVVVPTRPSRQFRLTLEDVQARLTPRTRVLVLSYPNNPTGAVMRREDLLPLARLAERQDLLVISDEIYAELTYEGRHTAFASLPGMRERTLLVGGLSKAFAMTGWRIGYVCGPASLIRGLLKIHQYTMLCAPIMSQKAAVEALRRGQEAVEEMVREYDMRRRLVVHSLRQMGLECFEPQGAFYVFPSFRSLTNWTAEEFCARLLQEERVAVVPGTAFGEGGEGHFRLSYAAATGTLMEALRRLASFCARHRQRQWQVGLG
ncbi:MAG: aminotransferase class I/II-fold pyridoxal phosphate-dependent enzyme [Moorellales bacterium]